MITLKFTGHVGRDAEIKEVNGKQVLTFSVACKQGKDEPVIWVNCDYWTGTKVGQFIKKGTQIAVTGQLKEREHEGKKYQSCNVLQIELLSSRQEQKRTINRAG
jgi:single-stranded DNA-binding protein